MNNTVCLTEQAFLSAPIIDTSFALVITDVTDTAKVKEKLVKLYGESVEVVADGVAVTVNGLTVAKEISVRPQPDFAKCRYNAADVMRVIARLTLEDGGCPWDKVQTHDSIRINMIEEAYEAVDAIDKRDVENMREEFGDVFLQSVLQSDISRRSGEFDFDDVCDELCKKLIGRHTFIFGADSAGNADEALGLWEKAKATEKNYDSVAAQLKRLPESFPALLYSQKTYKKIKKSGAKVDPQAQLDKALAARDHTAAIDACVALLADSGKDAEVELNGFVRDKISKL